MADGVKNGDGVGKEGVVTIPLIPSPCISEKNKLFLYVQNTYVSIDLWVVQLCAFLMDGCVCMFKNVCKRKPLCIFCKYAQPPKHPLLNKEFLKTFDSANIYTL